MAFADWTIKQFGLVRKNDSGLVGPFGESIQTGGPVGEFATAAALETAYPAATNAGKAATVGGVTYIASGGIWSPVSGAANAPNAYGPNYSFQTFAELAKALGASTGHIGFSGDSTAAGTGSGNSDLYSLPAMISSQLALRGIPSAGSGLVPMYRETGDSPSWSKTSWGDFGRITGMMQGSVPCTFAHSASGDAVRVMYGHSGVSFDVAVDGGAATRVTTNGSSTFGFYTKTGLSNSTHSVVITPVSGSSHIYAAEVYKASGGLRVSNFGIGGAKSNECMSTASWFHTLKAVVAAGVKVHFMRGWVNDIGAGYSTATTVGNMLAGAAYLAANGVVPAILTHCFFQNNNTTVAAAALAVRQAAVEAGYLVIDSNAIYGTYEQATANGFNIDGVHPNRTGYSFEALATIGALWL